MESHVYQRGNMPVPPPRKRAPVRLPARRAPEPPLRKASLPVPAERKRASVSLPVHVDSGSQQCTRRTASVSLAPKTAPKPSPRGTEKACVTQSTLKNTLVKPPQSASFSMNSAIMRDQSKRPTVSNRPKSFPAPPPPPRTVSQLSHAMTVAPKPLPKKNVMATLPVNNTSSPSLSKTNLGSRTSMPASLSDDPVVSPRRTASVSHASSTVPKTAPLPPPRKTIRSGKGSSQLAKSTFSENIAVCLTLQGIMIIIIVQY